MYSVEGVRGYWCVSDEWRVVDGMLEMDTYVG